ncbi:MAG TPA: histidinol-phosphate transaminase [Dehalococcoidia bacterium]|nr:histidinol-phosphate transaminase [Dehalococcoidia bacterium]
MSGPARRQAAAGDWLREWVQPHLLEIPGYVPIEPPEVLAKRIGVPVETIVKLDGNENPYGPSPRALEALAKERGYNIYPDPDQRDLRAALADYVGLGPENIVAGAGSDELIDLVTRMFVAPGEAVLNFPPTFGMYAFAAEVQGARVINLPRRPDFSLRLDGFAAQARKARLIFVVSPNNPSGTPLSSEELAVLLEGGRPVVVDEAYAEFAGESFVDLVPRYPNLMVLRTLSKWAGLAGLRVGYMVASPEIIAVAMKAKQPYSVSVAAETAALASLQDRDWLLANVRRIVDERERLAGRLAELPWLEPVPTRANFILCRVAGIEAGLVKEKLAAQGIMIRYFDTPLLRNYIRISVGKPEHTDRLIEALREIGRAEGPGGQAPSERGSTP